ncbi:uncharacterized protein I303_108159 [Kwoniella dejecticola CBS 10117]|uniref:Uncharacterized protein n=1 Tax=Kwoniella dejecticola CBS 10117 TaxID=1296121 RepID=A0A1A5ZY90_9TREE|nr:uncharacterized protein I303_07515 [Kwoniella dejecticola CBS 10117]OBR82748.1 hypothetical protein I303_07515 [Kwoniella dejecticola CBS 10117]
MTTNSTVSSQPIPKNGTSSSSSSTTAAAIPSAAGLTTEEVGHDSLATLEETRNATTSPPIDPRKLNNQPAPLPSPPLSSPNHTEANTTSAQQPLRSPTSETTLDSVYLNEGIPNEPSSHPTIAETGVLSQSPSDGPGPKHGQLKRAEKPSGDEGIIKLGSFGGEGLARKPPTDSPSGQ